MSGIKVKGNASGTGNITIEAPNTNTDRTLTLPDVAGEVLTDGKALPAIDGSALTGVGKVLQVVSHNLAGSSFTTSSTSWVATSSTVAITPTSATSKIFIMFSGTGGNSNSVSYSYATLFRGATAGALTTHLSADADGMSLLRNGASYVAGALVGNYLDSPNTTSETYYTVATKVNSGGGYWTYVGSQATITLFEISGD